VRGDAAGDAWTESLRGEHDEYVLQERIAGDDDRLEFYGACWRAGRPVAEFTGAKLRQYPRGSGSTSCARLTAATEVRELARRLLARLDYEGCADVEFKRGDDGRYHVIEVNARTALWHLLGELAGISLPIAACHAVAGSPYEPAGGARIGAKWIYLERDLRAARDRSRAGEPGWSRLARDLVGVRRCAVLSLRDPVPFLGSVGRIVARRSERPRRRRSLAVPKTSTGKASAS
jgi:predicted ATP-grasp superfamily ATP-dependent carboligase